MLCPFKWHSHKVNFKFTSVTLPPLQRYRQYSASMETSLGQHIKILNSETCSKKNGTLPYETSSSPSLSPHSFFSSLPLIPLSLPPFLYASTSSSFSSSILNQSKWYHMLSCSSQKPESQSWYLFFFLVTFHIHQFLLILLLRYTSICQLFFTSFSPILAQS